MATVFDDSESDIEIILDAEPMDSEGEKLVEKHKSRRRERLEARNRPRRQRSRTPENVRRSRAMSQRFEEVDDTAPEGAVYQEMKQDRLTYMPEPAPRRYPVLRFYPEDEKTSQEMVKKFKRDFSAPTLLRKLPAKIIRAITTHLADEDRTCLALSCRQLMRLNRLHHPNNGPLTEIPVPWEIQRAFLARIRPISMFGTPDKGTWRICESCQLLRPRGRRVFARLRRQYPWDERLRDDLWESNPTFIKGWVWGATTRCPTCCLREAKIKLDSLPKAVEEGKPSLKRAGASSIEPRSSKKQKAAEDEEEEVDYMDMVFE